MVYGADEGRSGARLLAPDADDLLAGVVQRPAGAVGNRHEVQLVAGATQQDHGAGHEELDVVGVCRNRKDSLGHQCISVSQLPRPPR